MIASNLVTTSLRENAHIKDFCCIADSSSTDGLVKTWEMDGVATKERVAKF
jgi:hypothetical protein